MKLYKTTDGEVFAYEEDGSQDHLIGDKVAITQEEADVLIAKKIAAMEPAPLTPLEKIQQLGLTVEDLKELLGVK